jgi:hypothetical protein
MVLDHEVGGKFVNDHVVAKDNDSPLPHDAEPGLSHLVGAGVLVEFFNEPMTERVGKPKSTPNDPRGHRRQRPRISFIPPYPASSA